MTPRQLQALAFHIWIHCGLIYESRDESEIATSAWKKPIFEASI